MSKRRREARRTTTRSPARTRRVPIEPGRLGDGVAWSLRSGLRESRAVVRPTAAGRGSTRAASRGAVGPDREGAHADGLNARILPEGATDLDQGARRSRPLDDRAADSA